MVAAAAEPVFASDPTELGLGIGTPQRQRRWTVALRGLLVLPHLVVLLVLTLVAAYLSFMGWFAALVEGRIPAWIAEFEIAVIAYAVRVNAYAFMLTDEYPPFALSPGEYAITVQIGASQLSRLKVFFRLLLVIPASIVTAVVGSGLLVLSPVIWLVALVLGRTPQPLFNAAAAVIRYEARYFAYLTMVTDQYPRRVFGDAKTDWTPEGFEVARSGRAELVTGLIIALGVVVPITSTVVIYEHVKPVRKRAVVLAEWRLGNAEVNAVAVGHCNLGCEKAHEAELGRAYLRFASSLSRIRFSGVQRRRVPDLIAAGRKTGEALIFASTLKDGGRARGLDPADPGDSYASSLYYNAVEHVLGPVPDSRP